MSRLIRRMAAAFLLHSAALVVPASGDGLPARTPVDSAPSVHALPTEWLVSLQFRPDGWGRWSSGLAGPGFFLHPAGNRDPWAEWEAEKAALARPFASGDTTAFACRFPERTRLLGGLPSGAEIRDCPAFAAWRHSLISLPLSLVYVDRSLAHPASAFGHLYLLFGPWPRSAGDARAQGSRTFGFGAGLEGESVLSGSVSGLVGGLPGGYGFGTAAWSYRKYALEEGREQWAFPLRLTAAERERLLRLAFEWSQAEADFLFASDNCALRLYRFLEAAVPRIASGATVPSQSDPSPSPAAVLQALRQTEGLLGDPQPLPSQRRRLVAQQAAEGREASVTGEPFPSSFPVGQGGGVDVGWRGGAFAGAPSRLVLDLRPLAKTATGPWSRLGWSHAWTLAGVEAEAPLDGGSPRIRRILLLELDEREPWIPASGPWFRSPAWGVRAQWGPAFGVTGASLAGPRVWRLEGRWGLSGPARLSASPLLRLRGVAGWESGREPGFGSQAGTAGFAELGKGAFLGAEAGATWRPAAFLGLEGRVEGRRKAQGPWRVEGKAEAEWDFVPAMAGLASLVFRGEGGLEIQARWRGWF